MKNSTESISTKQTIQYKNGQNLSKYNSQKITLVANKHKKRRSTIPKDHFIVWQRLKSLTIPSTGIFRHCLMEMKITTTILKNNMAFS